MLTQVVTGTTSNVVTVTYAMRRDRGKFQLSSFAGDPAGQFSKRKPRVEDKKDRE
jgi:hypothetical protein